jgi:predicted nucleic acid-binding Zn ribbon protein
MTCWVCGIELDYGGVGRRPRYCSIEHRRVAERQSPGTLRMHAESWRRQAGHTRRKALREKYTATADRLDVWATNLEAHQG